MKVGFFTLGCKVNQYETQAMEALLRARGHQTVPFDAPADAYIINTCTVTSISDKKSRQAIRRARRQHPEAVVAVCGCFAQLSPEAVAALDVDLIGGSGDHAGFLSRLEQAVRTPQPLLALDDPMRRRVFEALPAGGLSGRTRAMLKIEDGCVNFCSYCIIPYTRGPVRSLPLKQAEEEARRLSSEGYREIVLTGIEISSYGQDLGDGASLIDVVEAVCAAAEGMRVRLGSLEPRTITEAFCKRAAALPGLCPQFHLSLQSGCTETLRRMNRNYDTDRYLASVSLLHSAFHHPGITTDLIVGFPGETEAEFSDTLDFIRHCSFSAMHIFPYSNRPGTPAADLPGQVSGAAKADRAHRAATCAAEMEQAYLLGCIGDTYPVLFEDGGAGFSRGHAPNYAPVTVRQEGLHNRVLPVSITSLGENGLIGVLV